MRRSAEAMETHDVVPPIVPRQLETAQHTAVTCTVPFWKDDMTGAQRAIFVDCLPSAASTLVGAASVPRLKREIARMDVNL